MALEPGGRTRVSSWGAGSRSSVMPPSLPELHPVVRRTPEARLGGFAEGDEAAGQAGDDDGAAAPEERLSARESSGRGLVGK